MNEDGPPRNLLHALPWVIATLVAVHACMAVTRVTSPRRERVTPVVVVREVPSQRVIVRTEPGRPFRVAEDMVVGPRLETEARREVAVP